MLQERFIYYKRIREHRPKEEWQGIISGRIKLGGYERHHKFRKKLKPKLKGRKEEEKDLLILEYGKREILDERNSSIRARIEILVEKMLEESGNEFTEEEKKEKVEMVTHNILAFTQSETADGVKIADLLEQYNVLDEKAQNELRERFAACFTEVIDLDIKSAKIFAAINLLLEEISSDIDVARKSIDEYESHYTLMWEMGEKGVTKEKWEEELKKAMQREAEEEKKLEYEMVLPKFYIPAADTEKVPYGTVKSMGNRMGVHIEEVNSPQTAGIEGEVYQVTFPMLKRAAGFRPWLKIDRRGSNDMREWRFHMERPFVDPENTKGRPIGGREYVTEEYTVQQMPYALNLMAFEYILNKEIKFENVSREDVSANDILRDQDMAYIAQRLCTNVKISQEPIQIKHMAVFRNAMIILFKRDEGMEGEGEISISLRIKKFKEMLRNDNIRDRIVEILEMDSSRIYTFSGFMALIGRNEEEELEI